MIYQQYATAIKKAYAGDDSLAGMYEMATQCREWLAYLNIDPDLRDPLVEQVAWIEEAFKDLLARSSDK